MRRFAIILLAVATALMMALPATAKKPVKPDPEPEPAAMYLATIEIVDPNIDDDVPGYGVATVCADAIEMTRTDARGGSVIHFESEGAMLSINAADLALDGAAITGCHGAEVFPEYFRVTFDGEEVAMLWIFDVGQAELEKTHPVKGTTTEIVRTDLRMGGPYVGDDFAAWGHGEEGGVFTTGGEGTFAFVEYVAGRDPLFVELSGSPVVFNLQITLTPKPQS
ncbi:MAG: hypothetical protein U9Q95_03980 [Candidatus Eisenbacteria bacterium]|nr:hypothetical protein [Candidatus Eisenbacteria bacterium]